MSPRLNELAAKLLLRVVKGEMTAEAAKAQLDRAYRRTPCVTTCAPGKHGVCLTHGQSITECKRVRTVR